MNHVDVFAKSVLFDILSFSKSFNFVCISKVSRQVVRAAHVLAKECMI